ncbi:MAG: S46 family peptidase [Holophagaceae bacterium]|nr:S46 family peptidase [Holophagaceae bacterium]
MTLRLRSLLTATSMALVSGALFSDEGMWTFDNLPLKKMMEKYGFAPDKQWLEHAQLAAVNFGGGSASFISSNGLVITNHHVGRGSLQRLSTSENNYIRDGFIARTMADEIKVPNLTIRTVVQMENVTEKVNAAVKPGMKPEEAAQARSQALASIAQELGDKTRLEPRQVTLYSGGEYWVYLNKVHTDVRLVAAPETEVGGFGGDPDNFTYPRHDLDFCMFRVYENDKPYQPSHFLRMPSTPLKNGDLTFVIGNPGRTQRQLTYAQMMFNRDYSAPTSIANLKERREGILANVAAAKTEDERRTAMAPIFGVENSLKAQSGYYRGLIDVAAMGRIKAAEDELRAKIAADPQLKADAGNSHARIEDAVKLQISVFKEQQVPGFFTAAGDLSVRLMSIMNIVNRPATAQATPAGGRGGNQVARDRELAVGNFAFDKAIETRNLTVALEKSVKELGPNHKFVKSVLGNRSAEAVAKAAVDGTQLASADARKALLDGGKVAVDASKDSLLALLKQVIELQANVTKVNGQAQAIISDHSLRIAKARFAVYGKEMYPDATGTLRLTYGAVQTYEGNGTKMQPFTTFYGLYDRHIGWGGNEAKAENGSWTLPQRWLDAKDKINLTTPLNFVHDVDTIGGNSGSPVLNVKGEIVGLLFDGTYESLPNNYFYDVKYNRSVSVDMRAVLESLWSVYDAAHLIRQMGN